ncbi:MAG: hypothetical protein H6668_12635 [Ardenticatenaceae bacterium]|nr:hypothetical protein [Ardenticatenaceae bacterium]
MGRRIKIIWRGAQEQGAGIGWCGGTADLHLQNNAITAARRSARNADHPLEQPMTNIWRGNLSPPVARLGSFSP